MHRRRTAARRLGGALVVVGLICCGTAASRWLRAETAFRAETRALAEAPATNDAPPSRLPARAFIGTLAIPRLGFSAAVAEGDEESTLGVAVGHLPDTPLPWQPGNSGLAGHRNTFFRPLERVRVGDTLSFTTTFGRFNYNVRQLRVVDPDQVEVLAPSAERMLTLVTCYPFVYVGHAPRRFIVIADEVFLRSLPSPVPPAHAR